MIQPVESLEITVTRVSLRRFLADSITASTRMRFSVHTGVNARCITTPAAGGELTGYITKVLQKPDMAREAFTSRYSAANAASKNVLGVLRTIDLKS
jgi:hypothetical protein